MSPAPGTPVVSAGRLGLLRIRDFRNVFLAQSISVFGDGITPVALTFAVLGLTGCATDLGLVLTAQSLPLAALALVGGVWADRLPRAALMVTSDLVRAAVQIAGATLLLTGVAQVWQLAILAAVHGAAEAFFRPAAGAIAVDGATFLVSAAFLAALRVPAIPRSEAAKGFVVELRDGWREVKSRTWLWVMLLRAGLGLVASVWVLFVKDVWRLRPATALVAAPAAGASPQPAAPPRD